MSLPRTPSFSLTGRRALIAGGSSGIGLGCACALAEAGAHVIVAARGAERVNAAVAQMKAEGFSAEVFLISKISRRSNARSPKPGRWTS